MPSMLITSCSHQRLYRFDCQKPVLPRHERLLAASDTPVDAFGTLSILRSTPFSIKSNKYIYSFIRSITVIRATFVLMMINSDGLILSRASSYPHSLHQPQFCCKQHSFLVFFRPLHPIPIVIRVLHRLIVKTRVTKHHQHL